MAKVLLVEDDPLLIDIYTTKLKQSGFEVVVVEKGEQAFQTVLEEMLLDIVLPHVDGWDILKSLKERAETKNIQVVILSNLGQKEEIEKGLELGAALYLIKAHYTPSEVVEEVNKLIAS
jgi:DNA-binding response OmpR family regulator